MLREARERKGLTPQQVAESTRMLVQIVEDLERENFQRIAAPLYGRGFIKLYAECVGTDPQPLMAEFMEIFTGNRPPQVARRAVTPATPAATPRPAPSPAATPVPPPSSAKAMPPPPAEAPPPASPSPVMPIPEAAPDTEQPLPPPSVALPESAVMPLDAPVPAPPPDLFSLAEQKRPPVVKPVASRSVAVPGASAQPRVRPFSGESTDHPAADTPPRPPPAAERPPPERPTAPVWGKSRVVVREVAKIWSGVPRFPTHWMTPRRLALAAGVIAGTAIVILGIRVLMTLAERSAEPPEPVLSQRVLPPPQPYVQ